jgi:iron complex transport system substrate-binding protein
MMPRRSLSGACLLLLCCTGEDPDAARARRFPAVPDSAGFPMRVEIAGDRGFELAAAPQRVLIANTYLTDLVTRLIKPERVLALPEQALTWSRLAEVDEGFRAKASFREIDPEKVLELNPDLLLCSDTNLALARGRFAGRQLPTLTLPQPRSMEELRQVIRLLARVLAVDAIGEDLLVEMDARMQRLRDAAEKRAGLRALFYSNLGGGGWGTGHSTLPDEMIRLLGMSNPLAEADRRDHVQLTLEELIGYDPDVIIVQARAGESEYDSEVVLKREPSLAGVKAIKNDVIVRLHPRLFTAGSQEILLAAEEIAAQVDRLLGLKEEGR